MTRRWKDLSFGKKLAIGFGAVLILVAMVTVMTNTGVSGILNKADMVIKGNKLDGILAQREIDHLNWVRQVNALLTGRIGFQGDHRIASGCLLLEIEAQVDLGVNGYQTQIRCVMFLCAGQGETISAVITILEFLS